MLEQFGALTPLAPADDVPSFAEGGLVPSPAMPQAPQQAMPQQAMPQDAGSLGLEQEASQLTQANPQVVEQIKQVIMKALEVGALTMEQLNMAVQMAKAAAADPSLYPRLRELAIQHGLATAEELPEEYDQGIVFAMLLAGQAVEQLMSEEQGAQPQPVAPGMAKGGLIPPTGFDPSGTADNVPIRVSGGEYVVPHDVVLAKGSDFFDKLLAKQKEKGQQ